MNCVADTQAAIWYLFASPRLSKPAKNMMDLVDSSGGVVFVPAISIVEIVYLIEKGRLVKDILSRLIDYLGSSDNSFQTQDLSAGIAKTLANIPRATVPDMPDRIIAATALHLDLPLITSDKNIRSLTNVRTIW